MLLALALLPAFAGDMDHYKKWTRTVTVEGLHNAYNGVWPDTFAIYPPVTLAAYWLVGQAYRLLADPTFALGPALDSPLLSYLLKLPGIVFHLLTGAALYRLLAPPTGAGAALAVAAAYLFNPAALFDLGYWGQPDAVYAFFLLWAVAGVAAGPLPLGWAALAAASLAKPQAWALAPLLGLAGLAQHAPRRWMGGAAAAAAVVVVVAAPYALGDRLPQLASLPSRIASAQPVLSANAHNLWWLVAPGRALTAPDTTPLFMSAPSVTLRTVGYGLWGLATLLAVAAAARARRPGALYEAAAFTAFAFPMLATRIHENHAFMALPLGALAAAHRPALWRLWAGMSAVLLFNMAAHDPAIMAWVGSWLSPGRQRALTVLNAIFALSLLLLWAVRLAAEALAPARAAAGTAVRLAPTPAAES